MNDIDPKRRLLLSALTAIPLAGAAILTLRPPRTTPKPTHTTAAATLAPSLRPLHPNALEQPHDWAG